MRRAPRPAPIRLAHIMAHLHSIERKLDALTIKESRHMATSQEILDAVTAQSGEVDSIIVLLEALQAEQNPAVREQILTQLLANTGKLRTAIEANA